MRRSGKTAVIALGGNAISPGGKSNIHEEFANTRKSMDLMLTFIRNGYRLVISHGNGPQVGNALQRVELARGIVPETPLGVLVADTQGSIGYMIEQSLQNKLHDAGMKKEVVTVITQVLIDKDDPACTNPTKFIGQFFTEKDIQPLIKKHGWKVRYVDGKGWRRVVPSPQPVKVINSRLIRHLIDGGAIVIAAGGGGIPVYYDEKGHLEGFDAVIDKDLASAVLADEIKADELFILTGVDQVALHFGTPQETYLSQITLSEARTFDEEGHFPPGSMGPKIHGAIHFLERGGKSVTITSLDRIDDALHGLTGTRIVPD
ncbi:carbamate kinase [Fidelibacter multiformis]|uniref:carbamate kinase n=1 Tax=Fidelibacter multiformis TaxID=3377529 RepID=UPI0037DC81C4